MADYEKAFPRIIREEGGFKLTNNRHDRGKQTYAGISRKYHPSWAGWSYVDRGETPPTELVRVFYRHEFWNRMHGDDIRIQEVAEALMSQYVNGGGDIIKVVQVVVGVLPDGKFGEKTLAAINEATPDSIFVKLFLFAFHHAVCQRYRAICKRDKTQMANLLGWLNRADGILL